MDRIERMETIELLARSGSRELFSTLQKFPKRDFSISELARTAGVPFASAWRIIRLWERAGVIETGKLGRSVVVRYHDSPYARSLAQILGASSSPQAFTVARLKRMLKRMKGVKGAYLFGSVARGEEKLSSDIDLAVLAGRGFDAEGLVFKVYEAYGTKVVPLEFGSEKELNEFLKGKGAVRLK